MDSPHFECLQASTAESQMKTTEGPQEFIKN